SAGCAFKNPPRLSAGRLIDEVGLKGTRIGDARVSLRHANFFVNLGRATCDDVLSLMEYVQRRVARSTGVLLEPEVRLLGERW
ncbi:MAG: UDP-N-acetylenolpyruvoylglucosamine reductase, partial [Candidatus Omnitrophica bacterium]|nr:UDP-N-acetylenolpyruvoylglucosamine reductase [Candidatus Omnitrophota bacterium]